MSDHPDYITEEHIRGATIIQDAAPDIIMAAQIALLARGVTDSYEIFGALFSAAWHHHKEMHGENVPMPFVHLIRDWANKIEAIGRPN